MRYLLDTNILSALVRAPDGPIKETIARVGEQNVHTHVVVASELRFGAAKKGSERLSREVDAFLKRSRSRLCLYRPIAPTPIRAGGSKRPGRRSGRTIC